MPIKTKNKMKKYRHFKEHGNVLLELPEIKKPEIDDYDYKEKVRKKTYKFFKTEEYKKDFEAHNKWLSSGIHFLSEHLDFFKDRDIDESEFEITHIYPNYNHRDFSKRDKSIIAAIPKAPKEAGSSIERCNSCGGELVLIRGKYPKQPKRKVCPTCICDELDDLKDSLQSPKTALNKDL